MDKHNLSESGIRPSDKPDAMRERLHKRTNAFVFDTLLEGVAADDKPAPRETETRLAVHPRPLPVPVPEQPEIEDEQPDDTARRSHLPLLYTAAGIFVGGAVVLFFATNVLRIVNSGAGAPIDRADVARARQRLAVGAAGTRAAPSGDQSTPDRPPAAAAHNTPGVQTPATGSQVPSLTITYPREGQQIDGSYSDVRGDVQGVQAAQVSVVVVNQGSVAYDQNFPVDIKDGKLTSGCHVGDQFGGMRQYFTIYLKDKNGHRSQPVKIYRAQ